MANYIKVTELVAREMGLTAIRNKTADGNYLLWQADILRFPGEDIFTRAAYCGGVVFTPNVAKDEIDGTNHPILVTTPEWCQPKEEDAPGDTEDESTDSETNNEGELL